MSTTGLRIALVTSLLVIAAGTVGFHLLEGWPLFDSFYMTVITIFTVGFSEIHPLHPVGRMLTMFLIITGAGAIGYSATSFTAMIISGEIRQADSRSLHADVRRKQNSRPVVVQIRRQG